MERIGTAERRARLVRRHHLAPPAATVETVSTALVGLHSSDPATVYLSARARVEGFTVSDLERALYDERTLVRMLGMRRTMFVVPRDLAAVMQAACTATYSASQRRRLAKMLEAQHLADNGDEWLREVQNRALAVIEERGSATAREIGAEVPEFSLKLRFGEGKSYGGEIGISTRILFLLATEGEIVRGRPLGTWVSSLYRWATIEGWLGEPLAELDATDAEDDLLRRWLGTYGPGTLTDLKWWTGWGVRKTEAALDRIGAVEVELDDGTGYVLAEDLATTPPSEPGAAFLPGLDPAVMGWKERTWFLGDHGPQLFDRNGNAGPTVWWDGRIVGGWSQRTSGEVAYCVLEDIGREGTTAVAAAAAGVEDWLGDKRVTPRFPVPLDKELRA